jgi:hypothetical protein
LDLKSFDPEHACGYPVFVQNCSGFVKFVDVVSSEEYDPSLKPETHYASQLHSHFLPIL